MKQKLFTFSPSLFYRLHVVWNLVALKLLFQDDIDYGWKQNTEQANQWGKDVISNEVENVKYDDRLSNKAM